MAGVMVEQGPSLHRRKQQRLSSGVSVAAGLVDGICISQCLTPELISALRTVNTPIPLTDPEDDSVPRKELYDLATGQFIRQASDLY